MTLLEIILLIIVVVLLVSLLGLLIACMNDDRKQKEEMQVLVNENTALTFDNKKIKERSEKLDKANETIGNYLMFITEKNKEHELFREQYFTDKQANKITKITYNKEKKATTVFFADKDVVVVKCAKGVKSDIYSAVAYALAEKRYGNNTNFKKEVDRLAKWQEKKY